MKNHNYPSHKPQIKFLCVAATQPNPTLSDWTKISTSGQSASHSLTASRDSASSTPINNDDISPSADRKSFSPRLLFFSGSHYTQTGFLKSRRNHPPKCPSRVTDVSKFHARIWISNVGVFEMGLCIMWWRIVKNMATISIFLPRWLPFSNVWIFT